MSLPPMKPKSAAKCRPNRFFLYGPEASPPPSSAMSHWPFLHVEPPGQSLCVSQLGALSHVRPLSPWVHSKPVSHSWEVSHGAPQPLLPRAPLPPVPGHAGVPIMSSAHERASMHFRGAGGPGWRGGSSSARETRSSSACCFLLPWLSSSSPSL